MQSRNIRFYAVPLHRHHAQPACAKVYWLPDYLQDNLDRTQQDNSGHRPSAPNCADYGWTDPAGKGNLKCTGYQILPGGTVCYKGCYDPCKNITAADCGNLKCLSYWQECPDKCKTCETCTPTDCSGFTLSAPPANASYSSCVPGCGDNSPRYKLLSCEDGYTLSEGKCADPCEGLADNKTDLGCQSYYKQCPSKCEVGKNEVKCGSGFHQSADKLSCEADTCEGFPLNSCPPGATSCESCKSGTATKYQINGCKDGYTQTGNTCASADCDGFTLSSCPSNASCNSCKSGTSTKYQINGCKDGYTQTGNTCAAADCDGFTLSRCPSYASCSSCKSGTSTKYKIDQCNPGYELNGNSCKAAACTGFSYSCISSATACETCQSGSSTKYRPTACKEGYVLSSNTCSAVDCRSKGYTLYGCPSSAVSCAECLGGTSTYYKINDCKAGYELTDNSCAMVDCQGKGYTFYSCPRLAADCETCLRGTSTYYRIKNCQRPLSVSTDQKSCICPTDAVVADEASLRLAFSQGCPVITASGTINVADTQITISANTKKFTGTNNASLHFSSEKYATIFKIEKSPETPFEISNLDFTVNSGGGLDFFQIWNRPTTINNISVNLEGTFNMSTSVINSFYSDIHINNLNIQADISTSSLFPPIELYNPDDYSRSFSIKNSEIIVNNTGDGPVEALRFQLDDNSSSYINIENTKISLNTAESNYAIWVQELLTSGYIELKVSGCSISAKSDFNANYTERNNFNSLTYINRAGEVSIVTR